MKKAKPKDSDIRDEYDFSAGVRGKYAKRYSEGSNVIILDPDVADAYPSSESVNQALRSLIQVAGRRRPAER